MPYRALASVSEAVLAGGVDGRVAVPSAPHVRPGRAQRVVAAHRPADHRRVVGDPLDQPPGAAARPVPVAGQRRHVGELVGEQRLQAALVDHLGADHHLGHGRARPGPPRRRPSPAARGRTSGSSRPGRPGRSRTGSAARPTGPAGRRRRRPGPPARTAAVQAPRVALPGGDDDPVTGRHRQVVDLPRPRTDLGRARRLQAGHDQALVAQLPPAGHDQRHGLAGGLAEAVRDAEVDVPRPVAARLGQAGDVLRSTRPGPWPAAP